MKEIVTLHEILVSIISERGAQFTVHFSQSFQEGLGISVNLSISFQFETKGHAERAILTIEDMLRACAIDFGGNWNNHLPLIEFSYNNNYQASIQMDPYEASYRRYYRSSIRWFEPAEVGLIHRDLMHDALEKVVLVQ